MKTNIILQGDCIEKLKELEENSINMCMTSPPYWALRDYGVDKQLGLEPTFEEYITKLCNVFDEVKRILRDDGTCWVVIGDTYMGNSSYSEAGRQGYGNDKIGMINKEKWQDPKYKAAGNSRLRAREHIKSGNVRSKSLCQIPFRFAIEMVNRGWILRNTIIWHKESCMPSSVKDRFTVDFEYVFFFSKNKSYYFETQLEPIQDSSKKRGEYGWHGKEVEGIGRNQPRATDKMGDRWCNSKGRNKRTVWTINPKPFKESHFAVYPEELCETPIKAGCIKNGIVLDPFFGAGTTGLVALKQNKKFIGIELNKEYIKIAKNRLKPFLEQEKL